MPIDSAASVQQAGFAVPVLEPCVWNPLILLTISAFLGVDFLRFMIE
jgi:hypothetical protein